MDVDKSANNEYPFTFVMKANGGFKNQSNNNEEKNLESSPRRSLWRENKLFEIQISILQVVETYNVFQIWSESFWIYCLILFC